MKVYITDENRYDALTYDPAESGIDASTDIIGNCGDLNWDAERDAYTMTRDDYDWWAEYLTTAAADAARLADLRGDYNADPDDRGEDRIWAIINEELAGVNDLSCEHAAYTVAFERVAAELPLR